MSIPIIALLLSQAPAEAIPTVASNPYCSQERATARRAWSLFIAKNEINDDKMISNGAKILGMGALMRPCDIEEGANTEINLSPLDSNEIEMLKNYEPEGEFVVWANCLVGATPAKAKNYIQASDKAALIEYARTNRIGGHDETTFLELISNDQCGEEFVENVDAQRFYEDVNWFLRVAPRRPEMVKWHEEKIDA